MGIILSYLSQFKYTIFFGLLSIIFLFGMCFSIKRCSEIENSAKVNVIALTDSIKYYKLKNGSLVASKTLLEGDLSTLKLVNDSLFTVLKEMKLKEPETVINIIGTIDNQKNDTVWIIKHDTLYSALNIRKNFTFNNKYRSLEGYVSCSDSLLGLKIETDKVYFDYVVAVQDNNVYISSNNPYVQYNKITGITIPTAHKKKWALGIGPNFGYGYNFVAKRVNPYVGIGVNIQYNILQW